jgi:hypothetical protein
MAISPPMYAAEVTITKTISKFFLMRLNFIDRCLFPLYKTVQACMFTGIVDKATMVYIHLFDPAR